MTPRDHSALIGLQAARNYLWDGEGAGPTSIKAEYVCNAVANAHRAGDIFHSHWHDAWAVLGAALGTTTQKTLMEWICEHGGEAWVDTSTSQERQALRLQWLNQLITDLEVRRDEHQ